MKKNIIVAGDHMLNAIAEGLYEMYQPLCDLYKTTNYAQIEGMLKEDSVDVLIYEYSINCTNSEYEKDPEKELLNLAVIRPDVPILCISAWGGYIWRGKKIDFKKVPNNLELIFVPENFYYRIKKYFIENSTVSTEVF